MKLFASNLFVVAACSLLASGAWAGFNDVTSQVGLAHEVKKSWGNPIWGDINGDGFIDLIVPTHGLSKSRGPFVYTNNGGTNFVDIRSTSGIGRSGDLDDTDWHGFAFGDYDGDGKLDLYIAEGAKGNHGGADKRDLLFRGNGNGTFQYVSDIAGLQTNRYRGRGAYWFDYDKDGKLDLFVKNFGDSNMLYHNNGDGTLAPVSDFGDLTRGVGGSDKGSIVGFADFDNDGNLDVVITGDQNVQALYHNNGDGTFSDITAASGMVPQASGKGVAWGDYDNDGFMDLFVARGHTRKRGDGTSLYHNNGNGTFTNVTNAAGVTVSGSCWGAVWGDYDNDGYLDVFVTDSGTLGDGVGNANLLFHNNGDGTFSNAAASEGVAMEDGISLHKGAAWGDYDNDGFLDLLVNDGVGNENDLGPGALGYHYLLRNTGNENHFLKIQLVGNQSNSAGIGARIAVTAGTSTFYRQQTAGGGGENDSQGSQPIHVGLGTATEASVAISWPSGIVDNVTNVAANSNITIIEGSGASAP